LNAVDDALAPLEVERAVVERLKRGERAAAAELYRWYGDKLYRTAILPRLPNIELAEDVLKDTFRLALERIEQYRPEGTTSIFFWLRRIAINRALDLHRAHARAQRIEGRDPNETIDRTMGSASPSPDRSTDVNETRAMVEASLSRVNERYAQALRLRLLDDRDREECAALMGVTVGNFDVILHRACKAFRAVYPP
jgi:RNA polymerase sigma-70 factor (ECF subfamily)